MVFNQSNWQWTYQCVDMASYCYDIQCDFLFGAACIRHGYWFGKMNADDVLAH